MEVAHLICGKLILDFSFIPWCSELVSNADAVWATSAWMGHSSLVATVRGKRLVPYSCRAFLSSSHVEKQQYTERKPGVWTSLMAAK